MNRPANVLLSVCLCFTAAARAQQGGDLEAQILYAYQVEDANQLAGLVQLLATQAHAGGADAALHYHLAHADYRLGLLGVRREHNADASFDACVEELKPVLQQDVNSADALALQGACYAGLARLRKLERPLLRSRAEDRWNSAARLDPRNPRALYLTAADGLSRHKAGTPENQIAYGKLQLAVQLFEQTSATSPDAPAWGHVEAYLEMGRQLAARGDVLGARNWIEKSLLLAPDFKAAQRELAAVVRR